jgi:DNA polymerase-4
LRIIALFDLDAFFASVEMAKNPDLFGKPIAVGGNDRRSVVATCSYEARKYGVKSAMPSHQAKKLCKDLIFVKPDFESYKKYSLAVREVFKKYTDTIEFASIDEAYLDLSEVCETFEEAEVLIQKIKHEIKSTLNITVTAGVSVNKFVAKISSEIQKPDGLTIIAEKDVPTFLEGLSINKFRGVGSSTLEVMVANGISSGSDLKSMSIDRLISIFGEKRASWFYNVVRGIDNRPVDTNEYVRKSVSQSKTFTKDIKTDRIAWEEIKKLAEDVSRQLVSRGLKAKTITIKFRHNDFTMQTKSKTLQEHTDDVITMIKAISDVFAVGNKISKPVRLFGVTASNFEIEDEEPLW